MKWKKEGPMLLYQLEKGEDWYEEGKFNGVAWISKRCTIIKKGRKRYAFVLGIALIEGELRFKKLKDAKQFAEKTIEWYF